MQYPLLTVCGLVERKQRVRQRREEGRKKYGRGGDKIKTGNHGNMHRRADMLMCKQACTQKTQHMRCKHARNCPQVCVCNLLSEGGGGHCDMKGASRRRFPPPLSTEPWRKSGLFEVLSQRKPSEDGDIFLLSGDLSIFSH